VPSRLLDCLSGDECDAALLPIIDYQRSENLRILPATCIGADGPVYTVRLYSSVPIKSIRTLHLDQDSHTSAALCKIILHHVYGCEPDITPHQGQAQAHLLIGDKVINAVPPDEGYELDLAEAWKQWMGLPFVFAAWMCKAEAKLPGLPGILTNALNGGMAHIERIVAEEAPRRNWPTLIARKYLGEMLKYQLDLSPNSPQRRSIEAFHRMAFEMGLIPHCRPLLLADDIHSTTRRI